MAKLQNAFPISIDQKFVIILGITMLVIPLMWGLGIFNIPIRSIFPHLARPSYWTFFSSILFLEWLAFLLIYWVTRPNTAEYLSINTSFLHKYRYYLIIGFFSLLMLAGLAPNYLYPEELPANARILGHIGPVSSLERIAFVLLSLTAGICEEVIFRGYGISVLERLCKRKPVALVLSSAAFMSLHGIAFIPWPLMLQYFVIGLVFGFFFQKYRRLEILILIHFLIDALIAVMVP